MSAADNKAVFLSYASQDAEAARRICEALQREGVEVWFDQSELVGGDAWDAKIRGQIAACALFVPVISAHTQERREGYFRIEWRLAAQRTHAMSDDTAFLLPVVIDDTRDADARVPAEFKAVQWTHLRQGFGGQARLSDDEAMEKFCARVKVLLGGSESSAVGASLDDARGAVTPDGRGRATPLHDRAPVGRRAPVAAWITATAFVGVAALYFATRPEKNSGAETRPPASAKSVAPLSPARELVEKARVLYEPWDLATKDDFVMADQFLKRATELDPTDGEVWAAQAIASCAIVAISGLGEDRRVEMRLQAERAVKLAPDSDNARFARALAIRHDREGAAEQAEPILREVATRNPENRLMLRSLGQFLGSRDATRPEGLAILQRVASRPGGDAVAEFNIGQINMFSVQARNPKEALAAFNRSLKLAPNAHRTHGYKLELLCHYGGDLAAARQALREAPVAALREDRPAVIAWWLLLASGEPDAALRILDSAYPYLSTTWFTGPARYLKALAHRQANRLSAATTEWNVALQEIQRRLTDNPTARSELGLKAATLAYLGRQAEAAETFKLLEELPPSSIPRDQRCAYVVKTLLGRIPEVVAALDGQLVAGRGRFPATTASAILFDPELTALRAHPSYAALAEKARAVYADVQLK